MSIVHILSVFCLLYVVYRLTSNCFGLLIFKFFHFYFFFLENCLMYFKFWLIFTLYKQNPLDFSIILLIYNFFFEVTKYTAYSLKISSKIPYCKPPFIQNDLKFILRFTGDKLVTNFHNQRSFEKKNPKTNQEQ